MLSAVYQSNKASFAQMLHKVKNKEEYLVVLDISGIVLDYQIREYFTRPQEIKLVKNEIVDFITNAIN